MQSFNQSQNGNHEAASLAEVLRQESERLRALAEECKKREEDEAEMRRNYPYFKRFVYDTLKERALREMPELPEDVDLEAYAKAEGAVPFETVIAEIERILNGK